jgi:hypothetical protein
MRQFRDVIAQVNERAKRVADVEALIELEGSIIYSEVWACLLRVSRSLVRPMQY